MGKKKIQPKLNIPSELSINKEGEMKDPKAMEEEMAERLKVLSSVYDSMSEGIALHDIIYDSSDKAVNYNITDVNPAYGKIQTNESI